MEDREEALRHEREQVTHSLHHRQHIVSLSRANGGKICDRGNKRHEYEADVKAVAAAAAVAGVAGSGTRTRTKRCPNTNRSGVE